MTANNNETYPGINLQEPGSELSGKAEFFLGLGLMAGFLIILGLMFVHFFNGKNTINYLDNLFNSISKGSANHIGALQKEIESLAGRQVEMSMTLSSAQYAEESATLFEKNGVAATVQGNTVRVSGGLGRMLADALDDADILFHNQGDKLEAKYGIQRREVLYVWWENLKGMQESLNRQELFPEGKIVYAVMTRGVETAYNYYRIVPQDMSDKIGMVAFALMFYIAYTIWYGYAILFMFEGSGLQIHH